MSWLTIAGAIAAIVTAFAGAVGCGILIANFISRSKDKLRSEGVKEGSLNTNIQHLLSSVKVIMDDIGILKADVGGLKASVGGLNASVGGLRADVDGLKASVHKLEGNANKRVVMDESPQALTKEGKAISKEIGAKDIAQMIAPKMAKRVRGLSAYKIQKECMDYLFLEFNPEGEIEERIESSAYQRGIELSSMKLVIAIELRDILLKSVNHKESA